MPVWIPNDGDYESDDGEQPIPPLYDKYHPSAYDVLEVRHLLLIVIPVELVDDILFKAKYWCRLLAHNNKPHVINDYSKSSKWQYLISAPLPTPPLSENGEKAHLKFREVVFWTRSRDQGPPPIPYDSDDEDNECWVPELYSDSWTWFETCIYRHLPGDIPKHLSADLERDGIPFPEKDDIHAAHIERVPKPFHGNLSGLWHLQSDVDGSHEVKLHKVLWTDDGDGKDDENEIIKETGAGRGKGFVKSLQEGDRIAVREAAVEVYYSVS
ncbi:hypothetical protein BDQ17DRAFT_1332452 [Cyathus striatus]|nr:hypothetical protein BDQ17DRAFT_1332452 [Cyathus striatus]